MFALVRHRNTDTPAASAIPTASTHSLRPRHQAAPAAAKPVVTTAVSRMCAWLKTGSEDSGVVIIELLALGKSGVRKVQWRTSPQGCGDQHDVRLGQFRVSRHGCAIAATTVAA